MKEKEILTLNQPQGRAAFFKAEIYPLLNSLKLLDAADFEYCPSVLKENDEYAHELWTRLMEMYERYHVIGFHREQE